MDARNVWESGGLPDVKRRPLLRRVLWSAGAVIAILLGTTAVVAIAVSVREPSLHRMWEEDVRVLASVEELVDGAVRLGDVRDWRYADTGIVARDYFEADYEPADVVDLWLYEQELGLGGLIAHTFLVFEFDESYGARRWLGLSVETRREAGETYSLVRGMLRGFELTHVWATEEDLVRRRVELLDYPLTRYRIDIPPEHRARIFREFLRETSTLAERPRWYHTLLTNCTSSLVRYVNQSEPGAIPDHYSSFLTGRADDHLDRLGYLNRDSAVRITREWLGEHGVRDITTAAIGDTPGSAVRDGVSPQRSSASDR